MVSGSQPLTDAQKNRANVLLSTRRSSPFLDEGASIAPTYHSKSLGPSFTDLGITILTLEQNPPERKFLTYIKIFSQEDFSLKSKL